MVYKNKICLTFITCCSLFCATAYGQVSTGVNTRNPSTSSILEISSTNKGLLLPRLSVSNLLARSPISTTPADGLIMLKEKFH